MLVDIEHPRARPAVIQRGRSHHAARPGVMTGHGAMWLTALREGGRIVDFSFAAVDAGAGVLLAKDPLALQGQRLADVLAGPQGEHPALIDHYRRVVDYGNSQSFAQVHLVDGHHDVVVHRVVRAGDGVTVRLTNLSADRRAQALRLGIRMPR